MSKIFRKITLQNGEARFYRDDVLETDRDGQVVYHKSIPDGALLKESDGAGFDDSIELDETPRQRLANAVLSESARIASHAKKSGKSLREAAIFLTGKDLYKFGEPGSKSLELAEAWRKKWPLISESDLRTAIERGVFPR